MIDPTAEMGAAFHAAWCAYWTALGHETPEGGPTVAEHGRAANLAGLAAVLAIVERDYRLAPRRYGQGQALHRKTTDDLLREVARVYRITKGRPVDAVAAHLNCATRTAWLWIRRAREAGLLPEVVRS